MREDERRAKRDSRLYEYGAKPLPDSDRVLVTADQDYASSFSGQVALLVFLNVFGRSSRAISVDLPSTPIVAPLPWAGANLTDHALANLYAADSCGSYDTGPTRAAKCHVHFGRRGGDVNVYGSGWRACVGDTAALPGTASLNPFGPAIAAVMAATRLFVHRLQPPAATHAVNVFDWSSDLQSGQDYAPLPELGEVWVVGTGSVGSAVIYFLSLATNRFIAQLFDHDRVKDHNITRSPIFAESDVGDHKVTVTGAFLDVCGVQHTPHTVALHESPVWAERQTGTPDILVPTANEYNVRGLIETSLPPIQIYGTTGRNWQASVVRHIPLLDPCSLCLFPPEKFSQTECATDSSRQQEGTRNDASLPFLSFAAGLMAAIELVKLSADKIPPSRNRTHYYTKPEPRFASVGLRRRSGCTCAAPNTAAQRDMIKGSRYAHLLPQAPHR